MGMRWVCYGSASATGHWSTISLPQVCYGSAAGLLRECYGYDIGLLRVDYGSAVGPLWVRNWTAIGLLRVCYGSAMYFHGSALDMKCVCYGSAMGLPSICTCMHVIPHESRTKTTAAQCVLLVVGMFARRLLLRMQYN